MLCSPRSIRARSLGSSPSAYPMPTRYVNERPIVTRRLLFNLVHRELDVQRSFGDAQSRNEKGAKVLHIHRLVQQCFVYREIKINSAPIRMPDEIKGVAAFEDQRLA